MNVQMIAIFALGATAGYAAHRESAAPAAASVAHAPTTGPAAPASALIVTPPPRVIVVHAPPPPVIEAEQPEAEHEATPDPAPAADPPPAPTGTLQGTVTDSDGQPLYNVLVVASSPMGEAQTYTSGDGSYSIANLPGAVYNVKFSRYGEHLADRSVGVSVLDPVELDVTMP